MPSLFRPKKRFETVGLNLPRVACIHPVFPKEFFSGPFLTKSVSLTMGVPDYIKDN